MDQTQSLNQTSRYSDWRLVRKFHGSIPIALTIVRSLKHHYSIDDDGEMFLRTSNTGSWDKSVARPLSPARLKAVNESNVIVAHHMGGWFEIDKSLFSSVATLFAPLFASDSMVNRVLIPDTISFAVFVAFKGMFHGDEAQVNSKNYSSFTSQLASIGVRVVRVYSYTFVNDDMPLVVVKRLSHAYRAVILWPRLDRQPADMIQPFHSFSRNDIQWQELKLYEKQDMLRAINCYKIHFSHGEFVDKLICVGPNNKTFEVDRATMASLSTSKYNSFVRFAGDINYVVLPAQISDYTLDKFRFLVTKKLCKIRKKKFAEFIDEMKNLGIKIGIRESISNEHMNRYRVVMCKSRKSDVFICKLNADFTTNSNETTEEPIKEITRLSENDVLPQSELVSAVKRRCII